MDEEQEKYLEESVAVVKQEAFQLQKALDSSNMQEVLKHASIMISELRTSLLSPKAYYELYMQVFDQMSRLESYFMEEHRRTGKISELYEKVQHTTNILPRLYLLVAAGSVYIKTRELTAKDVLKDLIEMTKGVQHPMRGLFLRYYLNKVCKDKLPDKGSEYEDSGDVTDSVDFLLQNLSEMNRLWVRMQHTGSVRDKTKREKERSDLKVTVGENIVRLSNLQGVNLELYQSVVLPRIIEIVTSSKDAISQQYLMDCIIQAFPDDYHLHTLEPLLEACTQLQPAVEIKGIFINLLTRISDFAKESDLEIVQRVNIFELIKNYIDKIIQEQSNPADTAKFLELNAAFLRLSLKCYPDNINYVNMILDSCITLIEKNQSDGRLDQESLKCIVKLLTHPLESLSIAILSMSNYPKLMSYLQFQARKQVSFKIVQSIVANKVELSDADTIEKLITYISSLLVDAKDTTESEAYEFEDEQQGVAKIISMIRGPDVKTQFHLLHIFRSKLSQGGNRRIKYTYPALLFKYIKLVPNLDSGDSEITFHHILKILLQIVNKVIEVSPELGLKLSLQCALCIHNHDPEKTHEEIAYEFISQALILYQDELSDADVKANAITIALSTLAYVNCFEEENSETLVHNTAQYAHKQPTKTGEIRGALQATDLFWTESIRNDQRVLHYLKKAEKCAEHLGTTNEQLMLLIDTLNKYVGFLLKDVPSIEFDAINSLISEINSGVKKLGSEISQDVKVYLANTNKYIRTRQDEGKLKGIKL
ncbi:unnamed protein product [Blepharisma stoltei]|uniref:Vacuolar protein sorting-associated protein 35 n=1 Tax=Blepharisma stoltei TaxID=1481888 RepID=A0AAU9KB50_9CILI|nr:unnamed protein product [Blepharisma stoltei]